MIHERPALERLVLSALEAEPPRIPVVLGGCGSGRTSLLVRVAAHLGDRRGRYIDVERIATTPERVLSAMRPNAPSAIPAAPLPPGRPAPRAAFDALLAYLGRREGGRPVLLLDEVLELRTLESFPGLRGCLREAIDVLVRSPNRFVLTSRYVKRARRLLHDFAPGVEIVQLPPLSPREVGVVLARRTAGYDAAPRAALSRSVHALAAGRPSYVRALAAALSASNARAADPVGALADQLAAGAPLSHLCRFSYELRLHRARGYGVLKAILAILAETEPLTLTEVARQLGRTPGSTKDYLSWLEDVDLIETRDKRYRFSDPLLRLWVRLHGGPAAPGDRERARQVDEYAATRLADVEMPERVATPPRNVRPPRPQDLIEID